MESSRTAREIHEMLLELDRLEELREELEERGLKSIDEIETRINDLGAQVEALEAVIEPTE